LNLYEKGWGKNPQQEKRDVKQTKKYNRQHLELIVGTSDYLVCNMFELEIITSQIDVIFQISLSVNELKIAIDKMPKIGILPPYAVAELVGGGGGCRGRCPLITN